MSTKKIVLFLASNPKGMRHLNLDEELRSIKTKLTASEYRDVLDLISSWAVRPDDLLQELSANKPTIVHFSGHGSEAGELVLMNALGRAKKVRPSALKALFSALKYNIRLVVLNACYSKTQAIAIAHVIDCVVGMKASIGNQAAITFAAAFYRAIGFGGSVKEAFEQGKVSLMLEGIPEENTPELFVRKDVNPAAVCLVDVKRSEEAGNTVLEKVRALVGKPLPPNESIPLLDKLGDLQDSEKRKVLLLVRLENGQLFESAVTRYINGVYFFVHPITKAVNQPRPEEIKEIKVLSVAE